MHTTFAPLCARVSQVRSPSPPVRVHLRGRHDCPTWAGLLEWAASAKLPEGSDPFELKHITLFVDLLQAKAALKQPDIKKVFRIKSLLAKCREHVLTALLNAYRLVLMEQLRVLKADGYTEARALSIGKGGARLHDLVEECCRAVRMPMCMLENVPHLSCELNGRLNGAPYLLDARLLLLASQRRSCRTLALDALTLTGVRFGSRPRREWTRAGCLVARVAGCLGGRLL